MTLKRNVSSHSVETLSPHILGEFVEDRLRDGGTWGGVPIRKVKLLAVTPWFYEMSGKPRGYIVLFEVFVEDWGD